MPPLVCPGAVWSRLRSERASVLARGRGGRAPGADPTGQPRQPAERPRRHLWRRRVRERLAVRRAAQHGQPQRRARRRRAGAACLETNPLCTNCPNGLTLVRPHSVFVCPLDTAYTLQARPVDRPKGNQSSLEGGIFGHPTADDTPHASFAHTAALATPGQPRLTPGHIWPVLGSPGQPWLTPGHLWPVLGSPGQPWAALGSPG